MYINSKKVLLPENQPIVLPNSIEQCNQIVSKYFIKYSQFFYTRKVR